MANASFLPKSRYSAFHSFIQDPGKPQLNALEPRAHFEVGPPIPGLDASLDSLSSSSSTSHNNWRFKLDGKWRFFYSPTLFDVPDGFEEESYSEGSSPVEVSETGKAASGGSPARVWADLDVPSCWQMPISSGEGENARFVVAGDETKGALERTLIQACF